MLFSSTENTIECHAWGWSKFAGNIKGKSHRLPFQSSTMKRANHTLELVHSDVCGKIGAHGKLLLRNQMEGK